MSRRLVNITLDNLNELPGQCRSCVFWELDPVAGAEACARGAAEVEKEAWISDTLLEWGSCGLLVCVGDRPAGYVLYAPAAYVPRAVAFATSPVSPDAGLLMTGWLDDEYRGFGLGRMLAQGVARDMVRRGLRAMEAFGRTAGAHGEEHRCLLPVEYLLAVGFKTIRPHPQTPRLRLEIRSMITWREDVESALERLISSIQSSAVLRPH